MRKRALDIALRTAHLAAMGVLLGGHAFAVDSHRLELALWLAVSTGLALAAVESEGSVLWLHQGRGVLTLAKVLLLCAVPVFWDARIVLLLTVVVLGSVGAHMPSRFRYYSFIHRRVIPHGCAPGVARLRQERACDGS